VRANKLHLVYYVSKYEAAAVVYHKDKRSDHAIALKIKCGNNLLITRQLFGHVE